MKNFSKKLNFVKIFPNPNKDHTKRNKNGYYIYSECTRLPKSGQVGGVQD